MDTEQKLPVLNAEQIRVLGALMEKSRTTPDYYPMTLNGLQAACNQKSARKPVVEYDENIIVDALNSLKIAGLISTATGGTSRATKYKHNISVAYPLVPAEWSVLCLLFLRGPLTSGEINSNSNRLFEFETLEEVQQTCEKLATEGYVKLLPRKAGQKEQRYIHLFAGDTTAFEEEYLTGEEATVPRTALDERLIKVEAELAELKDKFEKLLVELGVNG